MKLNDYLSPKGNVNDLAQKLGIPAALLSQWKNGVRYVPAERCIEIERATNGAVRCEELRPDIDWAYLRATDCPTISSAPAVHLQASPTPHSTATGAFYS